MLVQCQVSLDLSVLVEILSVDDSDHGTGPRRYKVNIMSNIKKVMLTKDALLSSRLADSFCKLDNIFLTSQASKFY